MTCGLGDCLGWLGLVGIWAHRTLGRVFGVVGWMGEGFLKENYRQEKGSIALPEFLIFYPNAQ